MKVTRPPDLPSLLQARRLTEPCIRAAIDRLDPSTRQVCGYHFGYWDRDGRPVSGAGKGVRAALALLSTRVADAPVEVGVPAAVACELVHNFSLLHDDLMDRDERRHHRATVWTVYGQSAAILAGDALLALASETLAEADSPHTAAAIRHLGSATRQLISGQAADLEFESRSDVSRVDCVRMASDKTGALMACAASSGAVLAGAPATVIGALDAYGSHLGLAFQLIDDLLGIWGSPDRTGKPIWSDLRSRKKSLPVVAALESRTDDADRLRRLLAYDQELDESQLEEAATLVQKAGGRAWA
ncbi:MAG: polyprenyl synthetase family protein, partial [Nocardioidaceae bacterium]